ncbi:MAG: hypothetical protein DMG12_20385 [Acidobacteria bacterium]|nr:MAG: hypothetical protein DMG12_20385 [Acidobacteriota bacterium]
MLKQCAVGLLTLLLSAALLQAHGGATHLLGTVSAVDGNRVTIKDKSGKSVVVVTNTSTKYLRGEKPATSAELTVGSRVVIDAKMDNATKTYVAEEVRVGAATTAAAKAPTPAHK